jgi:hypothetical protein
VKLLSKAEGELALEVVLELLLLDRLPIVSLSVLMPERSAL